jgi:serine protease Do
MKTGILTLVCVCAMSLAAPSAFAQRRTVVIGQDPTSYLGVGVRDITPDRAKALNLKDERGAEVAHLDEDGPAAKAGIKEGDVVLEYNGQAIEGTQQLIRLVRETPVGRQVKLVIWRNNATQTVTATLGERKGTTLDLPDGRTLEIPPIPTPPMPQIEIPRFQMSWQNPVLGIEGEALSEQTQFADFFGVKDGVLVKGVVANSAAEKAGIKAGDVITKVDDRAVSTTRDITAKLREDRNKRTYTLTVVRNRKEMPITVMIAEQQRPVPLSGNRVRL